MPDPTDNVTPAVANTGLSGDLAMSATPAVGGAMAMAGATALAPVVGVAPALLALGFSAIIGLPALQRPQIPLTTRITAYLLAVLGVFTSATGISSLGNKVSTTTASVAIVRSAYADDGGWSSFDLTATGENADEPPLRCYVQDRGRVVCKNEQTGVWREGHMEAVQKKDMPGFLNQSWWSAPK